MVPLGMLRRRVVWASCLNFALLLSVVIVGSNFMPIFLQSVKGLSPTMSGVYLLASILTQLAFVILAGALGKEGHVFSPSLAEVLTAGSGEARILRAVGGLRERRVLRRLRPDIDVGPLDGPGQAHRLPDRPRRPGHRHADSTALPPQTSTQLTNPPAHHRDPARPPALRGSHRQQHPRLRAELPQRRPRHRRQHRLPGDARGRGPRGAGRQPRGGHRGGRQRRGGPGAGAGGPRAAGASGGVRGGLLEGVLLAGGDERRCGFGGVWDGVGGFEEEGREG